MLLPILLGLAQPREPSRARPMATGANGQSTSRLHGCEDAFLSDDNKDSSITLCNATLQIDLCLPQNTTWRTALAPMASKLQHSNPASVRTTVERRLADTQQFCMPRTQMTLPAHNC